MKTANLIRADRGESSTSGLMFRRHCSGDVEGSVRRGDAMDGVGGARAGPNGGDADGPVRCGDDTGQTRGVAPCGGEAEGSRVDMGARTGDAV